MLKVKNIDHWGLKHAIRGMRNPMNSWHLSDSYEDFDIDRINFYVGDKDMELMQKLYVGGSEHRKYLRQIFVSMDITAPLYWWKEFDTYKIGTTANSCSTMHKIADKEFELDDFSHEHLINDWSNDEELVVYNSEYGNTAVDVLSFTIDALNIYRDLFLKTKDKKYWWQLIQLLPSSYNQKRTVTMNYENVINMIHQRQYHKLDEWHVLIDEFCKLPYIQSLLIMDEK